MVKCLKLTVIATTTILKDLSTCMSSVLDIIFLKRIDLHVTLNTFIYLDNGMQVFLYQNSVYSIFLIEVEIYR